MLAAIWISLLLVISLSLVVAVFILHSKSNQYQNTIHLYKSTIDSTMNHVVLTDVSGNIIYANHAAEKTTGYTYGEMVGNTPALWGKQMSDEFYKNMWHTIKDLKQPFSGKITNKRKNGEVYTALATITPVLNNVGTVTAYIGVEEDIELIESSLKDLQSKKEELNHLSKLMVDRELKMAEMKRHNPSLNT
jgi:PAS domain S-box-containing protein